MENQCVSSSRFCALDGLSKSKHGPETIADNKKIPRGAQKGTKTDPRAPKSCLLYTSDAADDTPC
eukprot:3465240-Pyramimonas_sp.AAC.1